MSKSHKFSIVDIFPWFLCLFIDFCQWFQYSIGLCKEQITISFSQPSKWFKWECLKDIQAVSWGKDDTYWRIIREWCSIFLLSFRCVLFFSIFEAWKSVGSFLCCGWCALWRLHRANIISPGSMWKRVWRITMCDASPAIPMVLSGWAPSTVSAASMDITRKAIVSPPTPRPLQLP